MKDLHKNRLLDQAKIEVAANVQLFEFTFDHVIIATCIAAFITMVLYFATMISGDVLLALFAGSAFAILAFYLIFGTK